MDTGWVSSIPISFYLFKIILIPTLIKNLNEVGCPRYIEISFTPPPFDCFFYFLFFIFKNFLFEKINLIF